MDIDWQDLKKNILKTIDPKSNGKVSTERLKKTAKAWYAEFRSMLPSSSRCIEYGCGMFLYLLDGFAIGFMFGFIS